MRRIKIAIITAAVASLGILGFQAPAQAAIVSGVSMEAACDNQRGTATYATLVANNAVGWRCRLNLGGTSSYWHIDVNQECRRVHGGSAWATYLNYNDPYSWRCNK
jgi:hypothetical protein